MTDLTAEYSQDLYTMTFEKIISPQEGSIAHLVPSVCTSTTSSVIIHCNINDILIFLLLENLQYELVTQ